MQRDTPDKVPAGDEVEYPEAPDPWRGDNEDKVLSQLSGPHIQAVYMYVIVGMTEGAVEARPSNTLHVAVSDGQSIHHVRVLVVAVITL